MPESLKKLINIISFLPWIWEKSASKLAFFLLNANQNYLENFANALQDLQFSVSHCSECWSLVNKWTQLCSICMSSQRDKNLICVVEEYFDMLTIENAKIFQGTYHVLWGAISPMNWVFVGDLNFERLFQRIAEASGELEIIMATNPNIEGEATVQYILSELEKRWLRKFVTITRLSRWLSSWYIEYADNITLINSIKERKQI